MIGKDIKISNAKGILIFLVVFGHFIEIYKREYYELFVFIYAFHMPLFIFISGYLAKRMRLSKIMNLILLYLIFQTFFNWVLYMTGDYPLQFTYGTPHFHLWYIVSLGFWYGITLIIVKLPFNNIGKWSLFIIILSISFISRWYTNDIVELVQHYHENFTSYTLSFQRTLSFMPFFFLGFFMSKQWLTRIYDSVKNKLVLLIAFSFTMFLTFYYVENSYGIESVFRGSFGTHRFLEDGDGFSIYLFKIFAHYLLAGLLCSLIMNLITNKQNIFTKWGDHSLTIFLFHPIFIFILRQTEYLNDWSPSTKLAIFLFISILVTAVLGSSTFVKLTIYICNPYNTFASIINVSRNYIIKH